MLAEERRVVEQTRSTLADRMQSGGTGEGMESVAYAYEAPEFEEEEMAIPGEVMAGNGLRLSNTREAMPELIAGLRKWRGMTQAQLGEAIGYPAPVVGNIEQGQRKLGLKTLGDIFNALGGELYIEFRQKQ